MGCHLKLDVTVKDMIKTKAFFWVSQFQHFFQQNLISHKQIANTYNHFIVKEFSLWLMWLAMDKENKYHF